MISSSLTGEIKASWHADRYVSPSVPSLEFGYFIRTFCITPWLLFSTDLTLPYWYILLTVKSWLKNSTISPSFKSYLEWNHFGWYMLFGTFESNLFSNHELNFWLVLGILFTSDIMVIFWYKLLVLLRYNRNRFGVI